MKRVDIKPDDIVYHRLYVSWGPGRVSSVVYADFLEAMFERRAGKYRAIVAFAYAPTVTVRCELSMLRKTPNKKKIREMVAFYRERGREAIDGGDRLILPKVTETDQISKE